MDSKNLIADSFWDLCKKYDINKISIRHIHEKAGLSRQTFYNHFQDKDDLIQYCYETKVLPEDHSYDGIPYMLEWYHRLQENKHFKKKALDTVGPNSLWRYIMKKEYIWGHRWHKKMRGAPLTEEMKIASDYYAGALISATIEWLLNDCPVSPERMAELETRFRKISLNEIMKGDLKKGPYDNL